MEPVDVAIIGAGPAGSCAALRMLQLGWRTALIESAPFPRPQVGESLSPGIWNILEYVGAAEVIDQGNAFGNLPVSVIWNQRAATNRREDDRVGLMVDRSSFDQRLLTLAQRRGAIIFQPAITISTEEHPNGWRMRLRTPIGECQLHARLLMIATGRRRMLGDRRVPTAPATLAVWNECRCASVAPEIRIEAVAEGFLWAAPIRNGHRLMAFVRPQWLRSQAVETQVSFRELLRESTLFADFADCDFQHQFAYCSAASYLSADLCRTNMLRIGEAALSIDPLASSGVEHSMRLSLKASIAVNTCLRETTSRSLAQEYYEQQVLESAATHVAWGRNYYAQAWPGQEHRFWAERRVDFTRNAQDESHLFRRYRLALTTSSVTAPHTQASLPSNWPGGMFSLSKDIRIVETFCVRDDIVKRDAALAHPSLLRPVRFLGGQDLIELVHITPQRASFGQLIQAWSFRIEAALAVRIAAWMFEHRLLVHAETQVMAQISLGSEAEDRASDLGNLA